MAKPYFTGNYGSALARVDTRPIIESGRAQAEMIRGVGSQIGGMIEQYGLNKAKRAKLTGDIEAHYENNPEALSQIGMSGDEAQDKKDYTERERFIKGDMNMAQLEGLAGKLARGEVLQTKKANMELLRAQIETQKENTLVSMENREAKKSLRELQVETREREQNALNQYTSQIHDIEALVASGRKPKDLSGQDQWLYVNRVAILNGQMPAGGMIVPRNFRMTEADLKQSLEKGKQSIKAGEQAFKRTGLLMGDEETARLGGDYDTWEDAAAKQTEFYEAGFVTTAKLNPNGGVDIISQTPIEDAEKAGEFKEVKDFPGHFVRKGDSHLYRKDDAGKLQQVGAPTNAQEMGQLQAYINSASNKWVDFYMNAMSEGKLIDRTWNDKMLPQSEWRYELDVGDDVPYNKDHETTARRIKSAQAKMDNYFQIDIRP